MLRICHIASGDLWAGAEVMIHNLLAEMANCPRVELRAVLLNEGALSGKIREAGIPCCVFSEEELSTVQLVRQIRHMIGDFKPDVVHCHRCLTTKLFRADTHKLLR